MADSQLRKGALELLTLGLLLDRPSYGGELLQRFKTEVGMDVSPGTLYPLLSRLHKSGSLCTKWEESPSGPPRKIYEPTALGKKRLRALADEWSQIQGAIAHVLREER